MRTPTASFTSPETTKYQQEAKRFLQTHPRAQFSHLCNRDTKNATLWNCVELGSGTYANLTDRHLAFTGAQLGELLWITGVPF